MLRKRTIFKDLFFLTENNKEKKLIKNLQKTIEDFYNILDLYHGCYIYTKLYFNLFVEEEIMTIDLIADRSYVDERTVRRFNVKTEYLVIAIIKHISRYKDLKKILDKHILKLKKY